MSINSFRNTGLDVEYNLEKPTYTLYINSADKVSGSNNNGSYNVNWASFLPTDFQFYKVLFSFQTAGGNYKDASYNSTAYVFSSAKVVLNFQGRSFSFDTSSQSNSISLGFVQRDLQVSGTTSTASNTLSCWHGQNTPKTISRPSQNLINVQIINNYNSTSTNTVYLTDTNSAGTSLSSDMTNWSMILEFIPIGSSKITSHRDSIVGN